MLSHLLPLLLFLFLPFLEAGLETGLGVRTLTYFDPARSRPLRVELWYPTEAKGTPADPEASVWLHPEEARNAPFLETSSKAPLLLISHGHRGDPREQTWLTEQLVRHGYFVAAVEHFGSSLATFNPVISLCFWERPRDISLALDLLLEDPLLHSRIDPRRIGFIGYSLGGMTGLGLAGATASRVKETMLKEQAKHPEFPLSALDKVDFSAAEGSFYEPRIQAMVLLCPASFPYAKEGLQKVRTRFGLIASKGDEVLPHLSHGLRILKYATPLRFQLLRKEISHYAFLNRLSPLGKKVFPPFLAQDPPCCDRGALYEETKEFVLKFFDRYLHSLP